MLRYLLLCCSLVTALTSFAQSTYNIENNELIIQEKIGFKTGTAILLPESETALLHVKKYLEDKSYISMLRIEGHVSGTSSNQSLSESRALAICSWLVQQGIDCKRLIATGFGNTKPIASGNTPETTATNTRISFINVALRGHLIGGMPADGGGKVAGDCCK
jgi:OmpA-OmpF porin, OOP family